MARGTTKALWPVDETVQQHRRELDHAPAEFHDGDMESDGRGLAANRSTRVA
jgi:hypothetical protein